MKKLIMVLAFLPLLVIAFAGISQAGQGRMGGMGDPYGLLTDESDFLIHPAKIAKGQGVKLYGDYRFTYTGVSEWSYNLDQFTAAGVLTNYSHYDGSGDEYRHNVLVGAAFPLGPGRMGAFFSFDAMRGDYTGREVRLGMMMQDDYNFTKNLDNFALRLLYGLPVGGSFNAGGEVQFGYRQEENKNWIQDTNLTIGYLNVLYGWVIPPNMNLLPFQIPYDSSYWEALFKGSLDGKVGPLDLEFTLRGGFIFGGDNSLVIEQESPTGTLWSHADLDGDVTGWRIGGDLWLRYALTKDLTVPFLVRIDYQSKTRDGEGPGTLNWSSWYVSYEAEEKDFQLTVGGGLDKKLGARTEIAAGVYYNYIQGENNVENTLTPNYNYDNSDCPSSTEHRVMLRLAGQHELSPIAALRMGLNFFYGWAKEDYAFTYLGVLPSQIVDLSLNGHGPHWGIGASLGGTIKLKPITVEPFINFAWQQYDLNGGGESTNLVLPANPCDMDKSRNEWSIGGGCSFLYDIP